MDYTFTDEQRNIFLDRYALKNEEGNPIEDRPEQMWRRVAAHIANDPDEEKAFYDILHGFKFVPGGRILSGAGAESEKTFYNCYVIPVETRVRRQARTTGEDWHGADPGADSREAIFDTIATMVDIMSRGGGVGINWSTLRPSGSYLTRVSGTSSGPVGWMDVASTAVGEVEQGGSRRGAAMFMLDDWHPDVEKFINAKRQDKKITNANISVAVSNDFMDAVEKDADWEFVFPDTTDDRYNVDWDGDLARWKASGGRVKVYGRKPAREVWQSISQAAHASGEPGVVFLDRYNDLSTAKGVERIISVNPCGEQGLGAYSVCNLGAMNLWAYVRTAHDGDPIFDFKSFSEDVATAITFLDNAIDKNYYFLPETEEQQMKLRRIGLGVMGLADALVALGIRYGSSESVTFTEKVFRTMKDASIERSIELVDERGPAGAWDTMMWDRPYLYEYFRRRADLSSRAKLRNLFLLTQAPTGTTSLLAGVNSGIEPFFSLKTWREDRTGGRWTQPQSLWEFDGDYPSYVVTAQDISVEEHIQIQAAVQKYVDSSVAKTINAPKEQTAEETRKAFDLAWKEGLKGIAYYRDGSRSVQVLYSENPNQTIARLTEELKALKEAKPWMTSVWQSNTTNPATAFTVNFMGHDNCPGEVVYEEGCQKCYTCSWSAC